MTERVQLTSNKLSITPRTERLSAWGWDQEVWLSEIWHDVSNLQTFFFGILFPLVTEASTIMHRPGGVFTICFRIYFGNLSTRGSGGPSTSLGVYHYHVGVFTDFSSTHDIMVMVPSLGRIRKPQPLFHEIVANSTSPTGSYLSSLGFKANFVLRATIENPGNVQYSALPKSFGCRRAPPFMLTTTSRLQHERPYSAIENRWIWIAWCIDTTCVEHGNVVLSC